MLRNSERFKLHFGPYRVPRFKPGSIVRDEIRGDVKVGYLTDAPIQWPTGLKGNVRTMIVAGALVKALKREATIAIEHWWGVSNSTVCRWRRMLGIRVRAEGTRRLRSKYGRLPAMRRRLDKARLKLNDPAVRAKISAFHKGKPRPPEVVRKVVAGRRWGPLSKATRRKISEARKRWWRSGAADDLRWTAEEDEILRTMRPCEAVRKTGRTKSAVNLRRAKLGLTRRGRNQRVYLAEMAAQRASS